MILVTPEISAASEAALTALIRVEELRATVAPSGLADAALRQLEEALGDVVCSVHRCEMAEHVLTEREAREAKKAA
ncbi:MAG TPA: hypothetical protein PK018_10855 [Candidatus Competibacter sp.]|nr:hypothetical protein [Candidatus Competibacteraceae bacterium]MCP5134488.1 hypothetical protein [Gammaproteobacteria bacterium]HPE72646.1 hypothetical protein [Candidatus Competibacter sp.]